MTQVEWHEKDSELIIKHRYERVSPKGQVESVDRGWFRKVWSVDRFCELLVSSGFHPAEVKHVDSGSIRVSAGVAT
jgi:hypothetical protein